MADIEKSVLGSVRLDSDVWQAVKAMPESLNVYLRRELLEPNRLVGGLGVEIRPDPPHEPDGALGTITVGGDGGKTSATINLVAPRPAKAPLLKPSQKGKVK